MGDALRNAVLSRSSYIFSARKDNAEEVAKRRAAIKEEIEQRQRLARKLHDEKMARAVAQKKGHLLKQREAQQREMLRAKAVLDRRTQILAEKEKEKKEAMLAKVHALASRLTVQHKSRPVYAFGSSTPRELEYLTQLTREQKVYDRKLIPSERSPTAASGSSSHATLTPPYDSRHYTGASMTESLYVARPELKTRHKRTSNFMTQSMLITPKPIKTTKFNQTSIHRQSAVQAPLSATKAASPVVNEVPIRAKNLVQQHVPPLYGQKPPIVQSTSSEAKITLKTKPVARGVHKSTGLKTYNKTKAQAILQKPSGDQMNETVLTLGNDDIKAQYDIATTGAKNVINIKEIVNPVPNVNGIKKLDGKCVMVEVSDEKERMETTDYASEVVRGDMRESNADMEGKVIPESALGCATETTAAPLHDLSCEKEDKSVSGAKTDTAALVSMVDMVVDQETEMHKEQQKGNGVLKESQIEIQSFTEISEIDHDDPVTVCPDSSHSKLVDEEQGNIESTAEEFVQKESVIDERFPETGRGCMQDEITIQKPYEIAEDKKESGVSVAEANINLAKEEIGSSAQNNSTLKADGLEAEDLKLAEEKNSMEERRRIQDGFLEREQREREMRKAKLASIMSRTRGGAPSVSVVPPALHIENSEIEALKHNKADVPLSSEYTPMKNALSHTTASVLQKLATTNPKLLSVLQRNGSNRSLADELSAADSSMSVTIPGHPVDSIASQEGSSTIRHLPFEPDVNHRPVAMK
ncbi:hypothetical protein LOAG_00083 [Loa loa]|uniref:MAP7 domain-containing protein 2 n=1 Tax=Loa loa TaxID=7209 RepID=A0A1I7VVD8_LOALO|nr:hypothetical protein LOAG_00083 [Loa loa]EFO28394.1 hypothetical protein LOAG_00083 [Loa loa]